MDLLPMQADQLPERWTAVDPEARGVDAEALFLCALPGEEYKPSISIGRFDMPGVLSQVSEQTLMDAGPTAVLLEKAETESSVTQLISATAEPLGELRVAEAVLGWKAPLEGYRDTCVVARLICLGSQLDSVGADFAQFVSSLCISVDPELQP
ncbi:MAG TPA: hypothetical protein P5108_06775 [Marmoricola sp.]|nr:hypothetical protein [Marmoricola sp.]